MPINLSKINFSHYPELDIIADKERLVKLEPIGRRPAMGIRNFLREDIAEALYRELLDGVIYEHIDLGGLTRLWRGQRELGKTYTGDLITHVGWETPPIVKICYELFSSPGFINLVSYLAGTPLYFLRPATPYRFEYKDKLCLHDDLSDPRHSFEVVINLTKSWIRSWGGLSLIGKIKRRELVPTPDDVPFQLQKLILDRSRPYTLSTPRFNTLVIIRLDDDQAHGVTEIKVQDHSRIVLACIYGSNDIRKTTIIWR